MMNKKLSICSALLLSLLTVACDRSEGAVEAKDVAEESSKTDGTVAVKAAAAEKAGGAGKKGAHGVKSKPGSTRDKCSKALARLNELSLQGLKGEGDGIAEKAQKGMKRNTPVQLEACSKEVKAVAELAKTLDCIIAAADMKAVGSCEGFAELKFIALTASR